MHYLLALFETEFLYPAPPSPSLPAMDLPDKLVYDFILFLSQNILYTAIEAAMPYCSVTTQPHSYFCLELILCSVKKRHVEGAFEEKSHSKLKVYAKKCPIALCT